MHETTVFYATQDINPTLNALNGFIATKAADKALSAGMLGVITDLVKANDFNFPGPSCKDNGAVQTYSNPIPEGKCRGKHATSL